jgi:hypothetical protein
VEKSTTMFNLGNINILINSMGRKQGPNELFYQIRQVMESAM